MIGRHRIGAIGMMTLALGVVPLPPPPKPVDMAAAELLIHELQQNGLDPLAIAERAGAEGFVELGRAVLAMQRTQRAFGVEMTTPQLIAEVDALARPGLLGLRPEWSSAIHATPKNGIDRSVHPHDIVSTRPALGNCIPGPRMDVAAEIASEALKTLARAPKPAKVPRDRSAQRLVQAKERAAKSRRKARKGWT